MKTIELTEKELNLLIAIVSNNVNSSENLIMRMVDNNPDNKEIVIYQAILTTKQSIQRKLLN